MPITYTTAVSNCTTSSIWISWNEAITTSGGCVYYPVDTAWTQWNQAVTTSSCSNTDAVYRMWVGQVATASAATQVVTVAAPAAPARPLTEEQRAAIREEQRAYDERMKIRQARRESAEQRARRLLLSQLAPEQIEQYEQHKYFEVLAKDHKRRYRIKYGMAGNIEVYEGQRAVERLCIHAYNGVANEDNMLAQKLMLEMNEELFRKTANITKLAA